MVRETPTLIEPGQSAPIHAPKSSYGRRNPSENQESDLPFGGGMAQFDGGDIASFFA